MLFHIKILNKQISIDQWQQAAMRGDMNVLQKYISQMKMKVDELFYYEDACCGYERTALICAAIAGQTKAVEFLSQHELGHQDANKMTALMHAIKNKRFSCIQYLLKECTLSTDDKETALMMAAEEGYLEAVQVLSKFECGMQDSNGITALMKACIKKQYRCIQYLKDEIGMQNEKGECALMKTIENDCPEAFEQLVAFEINLRTVLGESPLICAVDNNRIEFVKLLLENVKQVDSFGNSALMHAAQKGYHKILKILIPYESGMQNKEGKSALMMACETNNPECTRQLYNEAGLISGSKMTALMYAATSGCKEAVVVLKKKEIGFRNNAGQTALMHACKNQKPECAQLLLDEAGQQDNEGMSALQYAIENDVHDVVSKLIPTEGGLVDNQGVTALMQASIYKQDLQQLSIHRIEYANMLINCAGKVDQNGTSALMHAVQSGLLDVVELLAPLEMGIVDKQGSTALQYAVQKQDVKIVQCLLPELDLVNVYEFIVGQMKNEIKNMENIRLQYVSCNCPEEFPASRYGVSLQKCQQIYQLVYEYKQQQIQLIEQVQNQLQNEQQLVLEVKGELNQVQMQNLKTENENLLMANVLFEGVQWGGV